MSVESTQTLVWELAHANVNQSRGWPKESQSRRIMCKSEPRGFQGGIFKTKT